MGFFMLNLNWK